MPTPDNINAGEILGSIPWTNVLESVDNFLDEKNDDDSIDEFIIDQIDNSIDLSAIIQGPVGVIAETLDGPVIKLVSSLIKTLAVDPEVRAARKAARKDRRAARLSARQERRSNRKK